MRLFRPERTKRVWIPLVLCGAIALQPFITSQAWAVTRAEHTEFRYTNSDRTSRSIPALRLSAKISRLAHRHSERMAAKHRMFDNCLDCLLNAHAWSVVGENVGYASTVRKMNTTFMHSPPHRSNILHKAFTRVGMGVVKSGGLVWVTEIFYRP